MTMWLHRRFGPTWPMHVWNLIGSTALLMGAYVIGWRWLIALMGALWGGANLNAVMLFELRRTIEREGWLDELDSERR